MKHRFYSGLLLVSFMSIFGCATLHHNTKVCYGLDDARLDSLGRALGFDVKVLGMSNYRFHNDEKTFSITAHNDLIRSRSGDPVADEPVMVLYRSKELAIPISQGTTLPEIELQIRRFIETK